MLQKTEAAATVQKKKSKQNLRHKAKKKEESKRVEDGKEVQAPRRCNTLDESRVEEFE